MSGKTKIQKDEWNDIRLSAIAVPFPCYKFPLPTSLIGA